MGSIVLRRFRTLEVILCGAIAAVGLAIALAPRGSLVGAFIAWGFAAFAAVMFELRLAGHRATVARVCGALEEIGRKDLDAAASVVQRYGDELAEEIASNRALARMMARRSTRFAVAGTWRGRKAELGTAIVAGRDFDQCISYACAVEASPLPMFRVMTRGALTSFARLGMQKHPVNTGDAAFDDAWVTDADEALCRAVLDEGLRRTLLELQSRLAWMQVASIEATRLGVVVRWPGEISPSSAAYLRDLAFEVHDRLTRAARGG